MEGELEERGLLHQAVGPAEGNRGGKEGGVFADLFVDLEQELVGRGRKIENGREARFYFA